MAGGECFSYICKFLCILHITWAGKTNRVMVSNPVQACHYSGLYSEVGKDPSHVQETKLA